MKVSDLRKQVSMGEAAFDEVLAFAEELEQRAESAETALKEAYKFMESEGFL